YPSPPPVATPARKPRRATRALVAAGIIVALLLVAVVGWAATHRPVVFSLSSTTVTAGDTVSVSADRLPANQAGRVELRSAQSSYPFRATAAGHADVTFTVPVDIDAGDHQVKLCWSGACRLTQTLQVLAPVASVSPSPSALPTHSPVPTASASPLPSTTPTSASGRTLTPLSPTVQTGNGTYWVRGTKFSPNKIFTLNFLQEPTKTNAELIRGAVGGDGSFYVSYSVPTTARPGIAYLRACDPVACAITAINVQ